MITHKKYSTLIFVLVIFFFSCEEEQSGLPVQILDEESSIYTKATHAKIYDYLDFSDSTDFLNAKKGFIATQDNPLISSKEGVLAKDLSWFDFIEGKAPETVNPSLWRQGKLNSLHGLFKVMEGIYQVRGFDISNMSLIASDNGWIIIDPLTSFESAEAAMALVDKELGKKPIKAVILTHSHLDHFGGIKGVISQEEIDAGEVEIIAPEGFFESAISENVIAGNAMLRRATVMFGGLLERNEIGNVGNGLGQLVSRGKYGLMKPTITVRETGTKLNVDGVDIIFQHTPEAEAPAEFMFYFPKFKAFCQAEEINHVLHNMYTLRGAKVRNGLLWAKYIDETIQLFGDEVEVSFGSHHWPTWGNAQILDFWKKQRDTYKYIHDQTLYLANQGYTMLEIAEMIELPDALAKSFANRDYYGTLSHNSKSQYQLYYGWFDGNPANLHSLPPVEASVKYVEYMGGADSVVAKAQKDFDCGEYRWVGMALNHVVFADPSHHAARELLAKAYTQLAYQAESGPWRNFYLTGAFELLNGINRSVYQENTVATSPDILTNMPLETFYDYLAVRMDRSMAKGKTFTFNMVFPDIDQVISLYLENEVLHNRPGVLAKNPDATITMSKQTFNELITRKATAIQKVANGDLKVSGNVLGYYSFQKMVAKPFDLLFNIVEP